MAEPYSVTEEDLHLVVLVQHDISDTIVRLAGEGIDPLIILAGLSAASAAAVTSLYGEASVARWFITQADIAGGPEDHA